MRKSKELKRTRKKAGVEFRRGNVEEARKLWAEAATGYKARRDARAAKRAGKARKEAGT